ADSPAAASGRAFIGSHHFPARSLRAVLDDDVFGRELVADAIGRREVLALPRVRALAGQAFYPRGIDFFAGCALEPGFRILLQQAEESAGAEQRLLRSFAFFRTRTPRCCREARDDDESLWCVEVVLECRDDLVGNRCIVRFRVD